MRKPKILLFWGFFKNEIRLIFTCLISDIFVLEAAI